LGRRRESIIKVTLFYMNLLVVSLVVGTMFGIWFGYNPVNMSYAGYLEQQKQVISALNTKLPLIAAGGIVLTIISAFLSKSSRSTLYLLLTAAVCLIIAGIVTGFFNQPINTKIMQWTIEAPPMDWVEVRDTWWKYHIIRLSAGIAGLSLLIIGMLVNQPSKR
jgi:uncharacterized membrane protein